MKRRLDSDPFASSHAVEDREHGREYFAQLRRKLRWQLLVVYLTPLLVLAVYFHFQYTRTLREGIFNHLRSVAENQRNTVDLFLQERVANVRNVFAPESLPIPPLPGTLKKALEGLRRESPTFVDLGLFRPDGTLAFYAGPHPTLVGTDYSKEIWYRRLIADRRGYFVSDVYMGFRGKPHFIVAVRRTVGNETWALRASVDPERFGEFVKSSHLIEDAEAFIVNSRGNRQTLAGTRVHSAKTTRVGRRSTQTQVKEVAVQSKEYLRALAWLNEIDWALVVRMPASKAYREVRNARFVLVGIMLLALVFMVAVVLGTTRKLVGKLEATDKAKEDLRSQLFNAAKLASVGEMAAGVAHEINNPLATIYEEASMMKDIMDPRFGQKLDLDDFQERLDAITEATMRGRTITRKLLAFARKHEPDPEPTDINRLIERMLEVKELDFKVSNIEVVKEFVKDLPQVMVNRNQMDQVLLNLLNNAKDAVEGDGRLTLRTRLNGRFVEVDVEDTGRGMEPEVMERVFFPFYTTKGVGKGTGLGLSISYGIIKALGGGIEVRSSLGVGTTFTVALPAVLKKTEGNPPKRLPSRGGHA